MTQAPGLSLASLDARAASETPFEFEYITPEGERSGAFLQVLGAQSPKVVAEVQRLLNDMRRKAAMAERAARAAGKAAEVTFTPVEEDAEFGVKATAARLVGWRGISDPWTAENALALVRSNRHIAEQITEASDTLANFMKSSPKGS